ncbi:L-2-hydroxyglutarate oxidase [Saccharomonospora iraqiensis]|uniref:L-2-hydroxyglutarate oxidase n=1 Tax=Saccharomonospora iraqiensis TaxID=52698 RepID=UPI00022E7BFA|nr:L-2-hydroxyglutarate oxidase [Saccharomonospora iraqiensis]
MTGRTVGIVGGGIVGLAVGRELTRRYPGVEVVVFEKEDRLATHQTGHNSGVVHAGIYYRPGSLKAELCARGRALLREYCVDRELPYEACGKLVVAVSESELGRFDALEATARENGVPGLRRVSGAGITELEPHAAGLVALHSPGTAITDYAAVSTAFAADIERAGGRVELSTAVTGVRHRADRVEVTTAAGVRTVDRLVVCGGLHADRLARRADGVDGPRVVPFRGEYMTVAPGKRDRVRGMIYPVPDPRYPFLGVHFTRRVSGEVEVGPNAVLALAREGYRRRDVAGADLRDLLGWPGFWRMARQHWRTGMAEMRGSLSVRAYMRAASRYVPDIGAADVRRAGAGVRAQAVDRDGSLVDDFRIGHEDGITTVRNAPSPAATSSLAIAEHVVDRMDVGG